MTLARIPAAMRQRLVWSVKPKVTSPNLMNECTGQNSDFLRITPTVEHLDVFGNVLFHLCGRKALRLQNILVHLAAVKMEERHRRIVPQGPAGKPPLQFAQYIPRHRMQIRKRL